MYSRNRKLISTIQELSFTIQHWMLLRYYGNYNTVNTAQAVTSIKCWKVTLLLFCHRNFHRNWTCFKRSSVLKDHFFLCPKGDLFNTSLTVYRSDTEKIWNCSFHVRFSPCCGSNIWGLDLNWCLSSYGLWHLSSGNCK